MDEIGIIGTTLGSFIIVALSVFTMIFVLLKRYEEQRKQLLTLSENLEFAANHDPLTRLYNRRYLVKQVDGWMRIPGRNFWIILMDVDDFKVVNDTYGHGYGDDVLREAGRLMLQAFQNIQEGLRKYSQATKQTDITISGGMERYEADKQMDLLFTSADRKLYVAKNNGKNRIVE